MSSSSYALLFGAAAAAVGGAAALQGARPRLVGGVAPPRAAPVEEAVVVQEVGRPLSVDSAAHLCARGWVELPGWLAPEDARAVRRDAEALRDAGVFVKSKVGSRKVDASGDIASSLALVDETRRSETAWLRLPFSTEASYAYYPEGGFYKKHVDVPRGAFYELGRSGALGAADFQERREYSVLIYLNEDWVAEEGGALRVFGDNGVVAAEVLPRLGTLVILRSDRVPHEVAVARRDRWAVVGWFRVRRADLDLASSSLASNKGPFACGTFFEARGYDRAAFECYSRVVAASLATDAERAYLSVRKAHVTFDGFGDRAAATGHLVDALSVDPEESLATLNGLALAADLAADGGAKEKKIEWHARALGRAPRDAKTAALALAATHCADVALFDRLAASQPFLGDALRLLGDTVGWDADVSRGTFAMLQVALDHARYPGSILEFGVYHGRSLRIFNELMDRNHHPDRTRRPMHGFDSFEGLPEAWAHEPAASYSYAADTHNAALPRIPGATMHKGWFSDTAAPFFAKNRRPVALIHLDCDLYSSTVDVLNALGESSVDALGLVLVFDDYIGHETWREDQHKALQDCAANFGWRYEYVALSLATKQAVVKIVDVAAR